MNGEPRRVCARAVSSWPSERASEGETKAALRSALVVDGQHLRRAVIVGLEVIVFDGSDVLVVAFLFFYYIRSGEEIRGGVQ